MTSVRLQHTGTRFRTPPIADLLFDAILANDEAAPQWYVLPSTLPQDSKFGELRVSSVEVFEPRGHGHARIARFIGSGGFQALLLPARSLVTVHELRVSVHEEPPRRSVAIPVLIAGELTIGAESAEHWLPIGIAAETGAEVTYTPGAIVATKDTPNLKEVGVTLSRPRTLLLTVEMRRP